MSDLEILYHAFRRGFNVFMIFVMIGAVLLLFGIGSALVHHHNECAADRRDGTNFTSNC